MVAEPSLAETRVPHAAGVAIADPGHVDDVMDIVIAGGGPVGAVLAHALAPLARSPLQPDGLTILHVRDAPQNGLLPADRPIALSWGSRLIMQRLGLWESLPATAITTIHVSQQKKFGRTLISAADHAIAALGYVVSYRDLAAIPDATGITTRNGRVTDWEVHDDAVALRMDDANATAGLKTRLLVVADGGRHGKNQGSSATQTGRDRVKDYAQSAIVCEVESTLAHGNRAWERFSPQGPIALLPFRDKHALVWTSATATAEQLLALDDNAFLQELQATFGERLGRFRNASARTLFPLSLRYHTQAADARIIAVGNAAQTLHPVAGQGLNLGLRDAWELAELITANATEHNLSAQTTQRPDAGAIELTRRYAQRRQFDRRALVRLTDGLISAFSIDLPLSSSVRGAALAFLDTVPTARRFLSRRMMFGARALP